MSKDKMKIDSVMPLEQVVARLQELTASLESGSLNVQFGQETMQLTPTSVVRFELKVGRKKEKERVSLEISWEPDDAPGSVKISSTPDIKLG